MVLQASQRLIIIISLYCHYHSLVISTYYIFFLVEQSTQYGVTLPDLVFPVLLFHVLLFCSILWFRKSVFRIQCPVFYCCRFGSRFSVQSFTVPDLMFRHSVSRSSVCFTTCQTNSNFVKRYFRLSILTIQRLRENSGSIIFL